MKLHPDDPRLTAYLLGELPADEAAAVERAVAADPALGLAMQELENLQRLLTNTLSPGASALLPLQREHILSTARHADQAGKTVTFSPKSKSLKPWILPLAAAAMVTLAGFLLLNLPGDKDPLVGKPSPSDSVPPGTLPLEVALLPAPGPPDAGLRDNPAARPTASSSLTKSAAQRSAALQENGDLFLRKVAERLNGTPTPGENDLPPLVHRGSVSVSDQASIALPVHAGRSSLAWITHSIREGHQRPPANAVRLEEILNQFTLRPAGAAAIFQGVTLSTESIACPWKPSATLLLVSFRGAVDTARDVSATFNADTTGVRRFRLLGFAPVSGLAQGTLPTRLPAKALSSIVLEIEPSNSAINLGNIEWSVDGQAAPAVTISRHGEAEPSDDARFAALVCTYSQWLAHQPSGMIDADLLAALARENAAETLPADRVDFLNLIEQSLDL